MSEPIVRQEIEIAASADQVWRYVATPEGLRQWWDGEIQLEPQEGGVCVERTQERGRVVTRQGRVTVYDPPRQITLTLAPQPEPGASVRPSDTMLARISITLEESGGRTRVAVVHQVLNWGTVAAPASMPGPVGPTLSKARRSAALAAPQFAAAGDGPAAPDPWRRRLQLLAHAALFCEVPPLCEESNP